jgi:hypothetical protein
MTTTTTLRGRLIDQSPALAGVRRVLRSFRTADPKLREDLERMVDALLTLRAEYAALEFSPVGPLYADAEVSFGTVTRFNAGASVAATLPPAGSDVAGRALAIIVAGAGSVVLTPRGDALVQDAATYTLTVKGLYIVLCDGQNWWATT